MGRSTKWLHKNWQIEAWHCRETDYSYSNMFPEVVMLSDSQSLWRDLLLHSAGPALFSFIAGFGGLLIAQHYQNRRITEQLRAQLIMQLSEAAATFYLQTQRYWRAGVGPELDARRREQLADQYQAFRVKGEMLEAFLSTLFVSQLARGKWHGVVDLLTVRYFQLLDQATEGLLSANSQGAKTPTDPTPDHSGLTIDQLRIPKLVLDAYRERLSELIGLVLMLKLKPGARSAALATIHSESNNPISFLGTSG
jgi:hypothetical protein